MMINKVEICGVNTAKLPVISASKMRELFVILQSGELSAREIDSWKLAISFKCDSKI